ncbi:PREDICTED: uncharacterized protein LOC104815061 [Tarenaya hassleriana]|uniref:uncharacterized protein LOC104815061 n=1 Tax=Tarenaya hassleriana TaxID=28532 RepID=UPI00053C5E3D|nr:PREDICTED: uncharacterized protein LOC104815061 [Tarenaya hassleriana]
MGNCLNGSHMKTADEEKKQEVKRDYKGKDRKVKIILTKDELEKLIMFQLNADGGGGGSALKSIADFLGELEAERAEAETEARRRCRRWRPSLDRIMEWPEDE